jgi:hypothetical protein
LLGVLNAITTTNAPASPARQIVIIGTTKGLAVRGDEGAIFGASVNVTHTSGRQTHPQQQPVEGYWAKLTQQLRVNKDIGEPIEFGDYGKKDPFLLVSSVQALKWLRSLEPGVTSSNLGLKIEFHELFGGKGGDSAGVTIATSAYSFLKNMYSVKAGVKLTAVSKFPSMWPRGPTAHSGDIVAECDRQRQGQCLRVLERSTAVCAEAKNTKSLVARTGSCGPGSQPRPSANAMWGTHGKSCRAMWPRGDVQAATSPANRIALPERSLGALRPHH